MDLESFAQPQPLCISVALRAAYPNLQHLNLHCFGLADLSHLKCLPTGLKSLSTDAAAGPEVNLDVFNRFVGLERLELCCYTRDLARTELTGTLMLLQLRHLSIDTALGSRTRMPPPLTLLMKLDGLSEHCVLHIESCLVSLEHSHPLTRSYGIFKVSGIQYQQLMPI